MTRSNDHIPVIIIGAGYAGLSISFWLKRSGLAHVVLERRRIADTWRNERWDAFRLVTPNWQCRLPGFAYSGGDPDGFMTRDEVIRYITAYAASFDAPVRQGVCVTSIKPSTTSGRFAVETSDGTRTCDHVVVAIGARHEPIIPAYASGLSHHIQQLDAASYRNPESIPSGEVLVVGSGQSGCQIAEDLHVSGRKVHLCLGDSVRSPRRYRGRDIVDWLEVMGLYDQLVSDQKDETSRQRIDAMISGRHRERALDLRQFARQGMRLYGRLLHIENNIANVTPDVTERLSAADRVFKETQAMVDDYIESQGLLAPPSNPYLPVWTPSIEVQQLDLERHNINTVIWAMGFEPNFSVLELPAFGPDGRLRHHRGIANVAGLYFIGLPDQFTLGSGRFGGIGPDSLFVADHIIEACRATPDATSTIH